MTQDRIPLDAGSSRPAMEGETELLPCPFCGGKPRVDLAKKTFCQLHGEPSQAVRVYCYHDCPSRPSVEAGDTFNGGEAQARAVAIAAWNRRALPSAPAVEGVERELVERLRAPHSIDTWHAAQEAASAISRLVKERDEALEHKRKQTEDIMTLGQQVGRAEASVARLTALLAEAETLIGRFADGGVDVSGTAIIVGYPEAKNLHADARRYQQKRKAK